MTSQIYIRALLDGKKEEDESSLQKRATLLNLPLFSPFVVLEIAPTYSGVLPENKDHIISEYLSYVELFFRREKISIICTVDGYENIQVIVSNPPHELNEILIKFVEHKALLPLWTVVKQIVTGGMGPGSYYFPVMIQLVLMMPVIWYLIDKLNIYGLLICFVSNLIYEVLKSAIDISPAIYRLCALRYIFVLGYGCFLYKWFAELNKKVTWPFYCAGVLGILYIFIFNYTDAEPFITDQWTTTSMFAVLYIVPIMAFLIQQKNLRCSVLERIGKASFNIFLVQMSYYWNIEKMVRSIVTNPYLIICVNIAVSCSAGLLFYKIENPITKSIVDKIRNNRQLC